jgi:hypothetical protein
MCIFAFLMHTQGSCKFLLTQMIDTRQLLLAHMEHFHIEGCPLVCATIRPFSTLHDGGILGIHLADCRGFHG